MPIPAVPRVTSQLFIVYFSKLFETNLLKDKDKYKIKYDTNRKFYKTNMIKARQINHNNIKMKI